MSEKLSLQANGQEYDMTPENAMLMRYKKMGANGIRASMYDHVLLLTEPPVYAWIDLQGEEQADQIEQIMRDEGFTTMLNMPEPHEKVVDAYKREVIGPQTKDLDGGVPEEWK